MRHAQDTIGDGPHARALRVKGESIVPHLPQISEELRRRTIPELCRPPVHRVESYRTLHDVVIRGIKGDVRLHFE